MPNHLKRPRSQREPTKNFDRYSPLQDQGKAGGAGVVKDEELEESMALFMDFVEAAANQKNAKTTANDVAGGAGNLQGLAGHLTPGPVTAAGLSLTNGNNGQLAMPKKYTSAQKRVTGPKGAKGQGGVRASVSVQRTGASTSKGSRPWTPAEEHDLMKLVEIYGNKRWSYIAQLINGRTGKQCRERWLNHLRPNIKKDEWSAEEERILAEGHARLGTKWSSLAKLLPGRTENSIKNHWNATLRCKGRLRSSKGSSRGNKPGVLKEYMDSLQRGLSAEKAVEIACFAEKLSTALAKEQPNQGTNGEQARKVQQEVRGLVSDVKKASGDTRQNLMELQARFKEKKIRSTDHVYLTKRHMPHIDEWSFQYNELGSDWAWFWKLHNSRAFVKIIERPFSPATDMKWPHSPTVNNATEDALTYTCVGKFDKGISTSQYNSRALQCVLSACVFVVQRNEDVRIYVNIYLGMDDSKPDTFTVSVHSSGGIGKTTGLQEMLRQIKTVLTLTANNDSTFSQGGTNQATALRKTPKAPAGQKVQVPKKKEAAVKTEPKQSKAKSPAPATLEKKKTKKENESSDSETISEPEGGGTAFDFGNFIEASKQ